jgi:hypothetical protein
MRIKNSLVLSGLSSNHSNLFTNTLGRRIALCLLFFLFCFSCSFSTKEDGGSAGWSITVSRKTVK